MSDITSFIKDHAPDFGGLFAALIGGILVANPEMTFWQTARVVAAGIAVNAYLAPLALHTLGFSAGPVSSAAGFISGLVGMKVVVAFNRWADKIENPSDFLHPFRDDKK